MSRCKRTSWLVLFVMMTALLFAQPFSAAAADAGQSYIKAYFVKDDVFELPDPAKTNLVYYAFAGVKTSGAIEFTESQAQQLKLLTDLKGQNPDLRVIVSFQSSSATFEAVAKKKLSAFVSNLSAFVDKYKIDGIDIDWEYPGYPDGDEKYDYDTSLTKNFFQALSDMLHGKKKLLTADLGNGEWAVRYFCLDDVSGYVDYFNVMAYDLRWNDYGKPVHDANLYRKEGEPTSPYQVGSAAAMVEYCIESGVKPGQIVLGLPFYAIDYEQAADENDTSENPAMGRPIWMSEVKARIDSGLYSEEYDEPAEASYLLNKQTGQYAVSYTSPRSIQARAAYVKAKGLAGLFSWNYAQDNAGGHPLAQAMYENLTQDTPDPPAPRTAVSISLSGPQTLVKGNSGKIKVIVNYSDGTSEAVTSGLRFKSSSTKVAAVSSDGTVTGKGAGTAVITVTYGSLSARLDVKVTENRGRR